MKIGIRRFKLLVNDDPRQSYIVESPHPDDAKAKLRFDLQLPIGTRFTVKEIRPRICEIGA